CERSEPGRRTALRCARPRSSTSARSGSTSTHRSACSRLSATSKQRFSRRWCWYRGSSRARGRPDGGCPEVTRLGIGLLGAVLGALAVWLVIGRSGAGPSGEPTRGEPDDSTPVEVQRGPEGVTIRLDATTRERIGLQVTPLAAVERPDVVRGFGRLLEPSALAAPVDEREAARSAFDAADREYRRVQTLQRR